MTCKSVDALGRRHDFVGLAVPAVGVATYALDNHGLERLGTVLLLLTFALSMLAFGTGRTNILFGL